MIVTTKAIVISSLKYGEADLIVKCFTYHHGLKTYLLKGILKSKKGKLKSSFFQPLTQLEIIANHKDKGTLEYLKEVKILNAYQSLHTQMLKTSLVMFLSEVLKNSIREEEENQALYLYLENTLNWLDNHENIGNFHLLFMLKLTRYLGFYPEYSNKNLDYFNVLEGTFEDIENKDYSIGEKNTEILRVLLGINFDDLSQLRLTTQQRSKFLQMLLMYYELHIEGFRKPKSLTVLNEIFN